MSNHAIIVGLKFVLDHVWLSLPVLIGYALGAFHGHNCGRVLEYRLWYNNVTPVMKKMEAERDQLWRSAVSKKQRLNRLLRDMGKI